MDLSFGIILYGDWITLLLSSGDGWNQIEEELVVDLKVRYSNSVFLLTSGSNLLKDLGDGSGNHTTILIILSWPTHSKSLACSSLTIDHHSPIETLHNWFDYVPSTCIEYILLGGVVKDFIELETPLFLLVIYKPTALLFRNSHTYGL